MQRKTDKVNIDIRFISAAVLALVLIAVSLVYVSSLNQRIEGVSARRLDIQGSVNSYALSDDGTVIYAGLRQDKILALDTDGSILWEFETGNAVLDIAVSENYVFAGIDNRTVYILDTEGNPVSEFPVAYRPMKIFGDAQGNVLVSSSGTAVQNRLQYFDIEGNENFSLEPETAIVSAFMLEGENGGVFIHRGSRLERFDATGRIYESSAVQNRPLDAFYSPFTGYIAVLDNGNFVYLFDEDLNYLWRRQLPSGGNTVTIDAGMENIVAGLNNGNMVLMDFEGNISGEIRAPHSEMRSIRASATDSRIFIFRGENEIVFYNGADLDYYARAVTQVFIARIVQILLLLIFAVMLINSFTGFKKKFWGKIAAFFRNIFRFRKSYLFLVPTFVLISIFNYYPAISSFIIAFADYVPGAYFRWVGLDNFASIIQNTYFWTGIVNMLIFLVTDILKFLIPPILVAELIFALKSSRGQYFTRVGLYLPVILPSVAGLLVWTEGMLGINGAINGILRFVGLGNFATAWLGNTETALWALVFIGFPWAGTFFIIFFGALIGVPSSLFEAAKIDGCGWLKRILMIDVPMISPQIKFVFVTGFIMSIQDFQRVYVTTMGGPQNSTYTPMLELFFTMTKFNNYGEAAAMGLIMFAVIFGATLVNLRMKTTQM